MGCCEHNPLPPKCSHPLFPLNPKCSSLWNTSVHFATSDKQYMLYVKCLVPRPPTLFSALRQRHPTSFSLAINTIPIKLTFENILSFHDIYCLTVGFSIAPSHDVAHKRVSVHLTYKITPWKNSAHPINSMHSSWIADFNHWRQASQWLCG